MSPLRLFLYYLRRWFGSRPLYILNLVRNRLPLARTYNYYDPERAPFVVPQPFTKWIQQLESKYAPLPAPPPVRRRRDIEIFDRMMEAEAELTPQFARPLRFVEISIGERRVPVVPTPLEEVRRMLRVEITKVLRQPRWTWMNQP